MLIQLFQPQTLSHRSVSVVVGNRRHGQIILTDDKLERSTHESCRQYLFIHSLCSETVSAYVAKSVSVLPTYTVSYSEQLHPLFMWPHSHMTGWNCFLFDSLV